MAVIVVGDIEPAKAEEMIKKHFSSLASPSNPRKRELAEVPAYKATEAMVVTDREATNYIISINYPAKKVNASTTLGDYRKDIVQQLFTSMLNQRLQELTQKEDPPFLFASTSFGSYARGYESFNAYAAVGTGDVIKGVNALAEEIERVKRFGFTAAELERAKKNSLSFYEKAYNNRDKTESADYVEEYINHFTQQEPSPGIEKEFAYVREILPGVTIEEVNATADKFKNDQNKFLYVAGPEPKQNQALPEGKDLLAAISAREKSDIKPYEEKVVATALMTTLPKSGKVVSKTTNAVLGTTEFKLSNGVTVTLKPTTFKDDQIVMASTRAGGKNNYGLADKYNAEYSTAIVTSMGVGAFSPTDLKKALAGKSVSVNPVFSATAEGVRGNSTKEGFGINASINLFIFYPTKKGYCTF